MHERTSRMQLWKDMGGNLTEKEAELGNTYDMPASPSAKTRNAKKSNQTVIKTAAAAEQEDDILKAAFSAPDDNADRPVPGKNITSQPQPKVLKPRVDVSGKEAPRPLKSKTASRYALPLQQRYPLDTYVQVKTASAYFDEWNVRMDPATKREFCQNLVKRAEALDIAVSDLAETYGSEKYASAAQLSMAVDARRTVVGEEANQVLDKLAAAQPGMLPGNFAHALFAFDEAQGLDEFYGGDVPDPYVSTFAKAASQESATNAKATVSIGNEHLPQRDLVTYSKIGRNDVKSRFGEDFADEFAKDTMGIFNSLPRDQKLVLMRMASSVDAPGQSASVS